MNKEQIESLPIIAAINPQSQFLLIWYNHFNDKVLYRVNSTNLAVGDTMNNEVFESWCGVFDLGPYKPLAATLIAADEEFKIDYSVWAETPFNLPRLTKRWFEIMDDEKWYVLEVQPKVFKSRDENAIATLAKGHAPILNFHPQEGIQCCFPSDAEVAYPRARIGQTGEHRVPNVLDSNAPCYYQYCGEDFQKPERVKYWFWYNYNDFPQGPDLFGSHPGDWESVEVLLFSGKVVGYFLSNHETARFVKPDKAKLTNNRIEVWVGNGSHANYPTPNPWSSTLHGGDKSTGLYCWGTFCDEVADGGPRWDTMTSLRDVTETMFWKDLYVEDWGDHKGVFGPPKRQMEENKFPV